MISEMQYVDGFAEIVSTLRSVVDQSPPSLARASNSDPSQSPIPAAALLRSLRQMWFLVRFVRFSYEQDFFGNY